MRIVISFIALVLFGNIAAQNLSLIDAISIALENNHSILVQRNMQASAANNVHVGNANLLPKLDVNANLSGSKSKTDIQFVSDPEPQKGLDSESLSLGTSLGLSYTLFDGFGNIQTYRKLQELGEMAEVQSKLNIESTLLQVINGYFEVLRQENQVDILSKSLVISRERLKRIEKSYSFGAGNKIKVLNAKVDFNTDSANVLSAIQALKNAKTNLNFLLGRELDTEFSLNQEMIISDLPIYSSLKEKTLGNNSTLLLTQSNLRLSEIDLKLNKSRYMPILKANLSYGYNASESTPSVVISNSSLGLTGSLTLAWNLFDGAKKRIALENASIALSSNHLLKKQAELNVEKELLNVYGLYANSLSIIDLETENVEVASLNMQRSKELFEKGLLTSLEFRQAQLNQLNSEIRLNNSKYLALINSYNIKRLSGDLLK